MLALLSVLDNVLTMTRLKPQKRLETKTSSADGLNESPAGRRTIITPINPATIAAILLARTRSCKISTAAIVPNMAALKLNAVAVAISTLASAVNHKTMARIPLTPRNRCNGRFLV